MQILELPLDGAQPAIKEEQVKRVCALRPRRQTAGPNGIEEPIGFERTAIAVDEPATALIDGDA